MKPNTTMRKVLALQAGKVKLPHGGRHVTALSEMPLAILSPASLTLDQLSNAVLCSSVSWGLSVLIC